MAFSSLQWHLNIKKSQNSRRKLNPPRNSFHNKYLGCENGAIAVKKHQAAKYFANLLTSLGDLNFFHDLFIFR